MATNELIQVHNIKELFTILGEVELDTLVILDVDEVIVYPQSVMLLQVAADFYYQRMQEINQRLGTTTRRFLESIIFLNAKWGLTHTDIPELIKSMQSRKVKLIALTANEHGELGKISCLEEWKNGLLKQQGVDLSISVQCNWQEGELELIGTKKEDFSHGFPVYKNGSIYTNYHPKAKALAGFLTKNNYTPRKIIFVDDRLYNLNGVAEFCSEAAIDFLGVHDRRMIQKYNSFDANVLNYQLQYLEKHHVLLDDAIAKENCLGRIPSTDEL